MSITSRKELIHQLLTCNFSFKEEISFARQFLELLGSTNCYHRAHLPGHITGSAWIVNPQKDHVLLIHHVRLNRWLQPGGHADGDENILQVALREASEETGLENLSLWQDGFFDLDIHPIPARNDFTEHLHYDVRFAFLANEHQAPVVSAESYAVKWIPLDEVDVHTNSNPSIKRMLEKTRKLIAN